MSSFRTMSTVEDDIRDLVERLAHVALVVAPPVLRIALALPFFKSGLTKWDGFLSLSPAASYLFEDEFKLHVFGHAYDFPFPVVFAYFDGLAEIVLPVLLILGVATRFSAFALLAMTGVIQLVVPEGWANFHLPWAALAVALVALGPGKLSLDHLAAGGPSMTERNVRPPQLRLVGNEVDAAPAVPGPRSATPTGRSSWPMPRTATGRPISTSCGKSLPTCVCWRRAGIVLRATSRTRCRTSC